VNPIAVTLPRTPAQGAPPALAEQRLHAQDTDLHRRRVLSKVGWVRSMWLSWSKWHASSEQGLCTGAGEATSMSLLRSFHVPV